MKSLEVNRNSAPNNTRLLRPQIHCQFPQRSRQMPLCQAITSAEKRTPAQRAQPNRKTLPSRRPEGGQLPDGGPGRKYGEVITTVSTTARQEKTGRGGGNVGRGEWGGRQSNLSVDGTRCVCAYLLNCVLFCVLCSVVLGCAGVCVCLFFCLCVLIQKCVCMHLHFLNKLSVYATRDVCTRPLQIRPALL